MSAVPQISADLLQRTKSSALGQIRTSLQSTAVEELSLTCFVNCGGLRKTPQNRPLDVAHARAIAQREWLAVGDLGLSQDAWRGTTMRPRRAMDEEGVTDIHVTGAPRSMGAGALECRRG